MWDIAPDGCTIVSLCNSESIKNTYSRKRTKLKSIINENGSHEYLGQIFQDAERNTDVEVSLIKIYKPKGDSEDEFDDYFDLSEEYQPQKEGLIQHNEILELVNRYVGAVKIFEEVNEAKNRI